MEARIWLIAGPTASGKSALALRLAGEIGGEIVNADALQLYRAEHDDKHAVLRPHPVHDWCSHAADAFRYLAMTLDRQSGTSGFNRRIDYPQHGVV